MARRLRILPFILALMVDSVLVAISFTTGMTALLAGRALAGILALIVTAILALAGLLVAGEASSKWKRLTNTERQDYVQRVCYSCRKPLFKNIYRFEGRDYCSSLCIPAINRFLWRRSPGDL